MKLRVVVEVDLGDGSYEVEFSDDSTGARLTDKHVPLAIAATARVLDSVLSGHARRPSPDSPILAAPAPDRSEFEN